MRIYSVLPQIKYSKIREIAEKVAMKNRMLPPEERVINLTMGQNFIGDPTPVIKKIGIITGEKIPPLLYAPSLGTLTAREAIANNFYDLWYGIRLETDWVMITDGAMGAIRNAMGAVVDDGDIVVVDPITFIYALDTLRILGRKFRLEVLNADEDTYFIPPADYVIEFLGELSRKYPDKNVVYYTQFGFNPSGAFRTKNDLKGLAEFVDDSKNVVLVNDIVYHLIRFDGLELPLASILSDEGRNICDCEALSKPFSLMGMRVGALITRDKELFNAAAKIQQYTVVSPNTLACEIWKVASDPANFDELRKKVDELNKKLRENFEMVKRSMSRLGIKVLSPGQGTLYAFIRIPGEDSDKFVSDLIEYARVAIVPGTAFEVIPRYGRYYARITISFPKDQIQRALERIESFLER